MDLSNDFDILVDAMFGFSFHGISSDLIWKPLYLTDFSFSGNVDFSHH